MKKAKQSDACAGSNNADDATEGSDSSEYSSSEPSASPEYDPFKDGPASDPLSVD